MSYTIETIAERMGARRVGTLEATVDWLLTDSRSLSFPEETLFFALTTKRNKGARYIPDLYERGVRNFVLSQEDFDEWSKETGDGRMETGDVDSTLTSDFQLSTFNFQLSTKQGLSAFNFLIVSNPLKALQKLAEQHREQFQIPVIGITGSNGKRL